MIPPRTVLAAVDFSESSRSALTFAARLAKHGGARLHVVHAQDPLLASAARSAGIDIDDETRAELSAFMQSTPPAGEWIPFHEVAEGQATAAICEVADRENADVIVVGAHGMSGVGRALFGSTTDGLLRKADHSVLVVPDAWTPPREDTNDLSGTGPVVVGVEPEPPAFAAAHAGRELAALLGTGLELLHVVPPPSVLARWSAHADAAQQQRLKDARERLAAAASLRSLNAGAVQITTGAIADQLAGAAHVTRDRRPVLVIGRRTHRERHDAPGHIAVRVLALTDAPVLMYLPDR
jgi:nucleotide-binding universal stress UspA family protein